MDARAAIAWRMRISWLVPVVAFVLGCASPQDQLKAPVERRCTASALSNCGELTEGVLLYADGDVEQARAKLMSATPKNSPSGLRTFASSLVQLGTTPRAEEYAESFIDAASLLVDIANRSNSIELKSAPAKPSASAAGSSETPAPPRESSETKPAERKKPKGAPIVLTADTDENRLESGAAAPGASPAKVPCSAPGGQSSAVCIKAIEGPFVITDLVGFAGCPNELFAAAGGSTAARWTLSSSSAAPLSVHGGRLFVRRGEFLFVGAYASKSEKIATDNRCFLLWSGFRPYGAGDNADTVPRDLGF